MERPDTSSQKSPDDAADRRVRAIASGLVVDIGGLPVLLRGEGDERAEALDRALGASPASTEPPVASIVVGPSPVRAPAEPAGETYVNVELWRRDGVLVARIEDRLVGRATGTAVEIGGSSAYLQVEVRQILQPTLTHLLAHHDRYVLHAGAFLVDGRAVLAFGDTGAGKSTLLAVALETGRAVLGDDLVMVRRSSSGVEACGVAKQLSVPADLPLTVDAAPMDDWRGRVAVSAEHLRSGWYPVAGALLVGHGTGDAGALTPMAGIGALDVVVGAFLSAPDPDLLRRFYPVAAALVRARIWKLEHARPAAVRASAAAAMLDQIEGALRAP